MKIYRLLFLAVLSCFALSCSQDTFEDNTIDNTDPRLAAEQFDNSYLGVYKGLFSTNDGLTRGSVVVTLSPTNEAIAQITLSTGELIELKSSRVKLTVDQRIDNLHFSSAGLSSINATLNFSVNGDGVNPMITNVSFDNKESDILIAKNLSRAPLNTITGTYVRTAGTGGFPTSGRTWNVMSIGAGEQTFATQIFFGNRIYTTMPNGIQTNCIESGDFATCDITGSARILGYDVSWSGTHTYDRFTDNVACSEVSGTWVASYGGSSGTFVSDSDCSAPGIANDFCEGALSVSVGESVVGFTDAFGFTATNGDTPDFCNENLFGTADGIGVWYKLTSSEDINITVDTNGSDFDTQLRLFSGTCGALNCIANDDDALPNFLSSISFDATANETYYIFVGGYNTEAGSFLLNVFETPPPPPPAVFSLTPACGTTLVDHAEIANYGLNRNDVYLIDAGSSNVVSLPFTTFNLENGWDFMRIYDGADTSAAEITAVNGRVTGNFGTGRVGFTGTGTGANSLEGQTVVSSGQFLTVVFTSDDSVVRPGFFAIVGCIPARQGVSNNIRTSETFRPSRSASIPKGSEENGLSDAEVAKRIAKYKAN